MDFRSPTKKFEDKLCGNDKRLRIDKVKEQKFRAVILAAGKGTRMKSDKAKVLHEFQVGPMLELIER
jgi:porphobilinogen deaminase